MVSGLVPGVVMMRPSDSLRLAPVVNSLVRNRPLNSAASSAIHIDGFNPSSERSSAGSAVISESAVLSTMRSQSTVYLSSSNRRSIVREVSRQMRACSSLLAITWTRRPGAEARSHNARPAASVVFPFPRATCRIPSCTRRRLSSVRLHPQYCAMAHSCQGCKANGLPVSSPTRPSDS